jgi:hypothetical protein
MEHLEAQAAESDALSRIEAVDAERCQMRHADSEA